MHHLPSARRLFARTSPAIVGALLLAVSTGCGGTSTRASASAGEDRPIEPDAQELWSVGGIAGQGWETFSDRVEVAFDAAGRVRIFDALSGQIHLLDRDGTHLRSWGERGEGPGELSIPMQMVVHRDGFVSILDFGKRGFVRFDPSGNHVADLPMDFSGGVPMGGLLAHPEGGVIAPGTGMMMRMGRGDEDADPTVPIRHFPLDGSPASLVHEAWSPPRPGSGSAVRISGGDHMMAFETVTVVAFQPELHAAVLPDGRLLVADSTTWTLEVLALDGSRLDTYTRPHAPILVTEEMRRRERERRLEELEGGGPQTDQALAMNALHGGGPSIQPAGVSEAQLTQIKGMLFAEELPVVDDLAVDWEGRIWLEQRTADLSGDGPIDLLRADGEYLATIPADGTRIPAAFGPNGMAAYIEFDNLDVPTVRIVRLRGLPG